MLLAFFFSLVFHASVIWFATQGHQGTSKEGDFRKLSITLVNAMRPSNQSASEGPKPPSEPQFLAPEKPVQDGDPAVTETLEMPFPSLPIGPRFYSAKDLDRRPEIISRMPDDSPSINSDLIGGSAILELWILESGVVARVVAVKSDISPGTLDELTEIFSQARFAPGLVGNNPVNTILTIEAKVNKKPIDTAPPLPKLLQ